MHFLKRESQLLLKRRGNMFTLKRKTILLVSFCLAIMLGLHLFVTIHTPSAQEVKDEQIIQYYLDRTLADNLLMFKGKYVRITLSSGETISGIVKNVNNELLHLEQLTGRNFSDALIRVRDISAMDAKFRGF